MTTLIFGASAGVGRQLCRAFAAEGQDLLIVARNCLDLSAEAAHCRLLYNVNVDFVAVDASDPVQVCNFLVERAATMKAPMRNLIFPIGAATAGDDVFNSSAEMSSLLHTNLTSIMLVVSAFLPHMISTGTGNIVGFGSIAAIRGRRSNVVYSAAKRALESYFESLRHSTASSGVRVQFYRLGYIATQQTFGRKLMFPILASDVVARRVVANLDRDIGFASVPQFWSAVGLLLKLLPWRIYRRLEF
jgi:short-subunit dehydrogenase